MDAKYTISTTRQRKSADGQLFFRRSVYVFNDAGVFTLILAESNEAKPKNIQAVINPIDPCFALADPPAPPGLAGPPGCVMTLSAHMPAIQAAGEGYEVYAVTDASGGVSAEAHEMAIRRMVMAGVVPITWMAVAGELQRDWARQEQAAAMAQVFLEHGGGTGIALAWELQLLGQKAGAGA
jgi:hypothetical protein